MWRIRWGSLRTKIIVWSFVPAAIILFAVALITFTAYQQVTEELVIERDQELTRLSASQLATELAEYTDLLTALARTVGIYHNDPAAQRDTLMGASNRLAIFDAGALILDTFGTVVAAEPKRPEILGQDWSDRICFRETVRSQISGFQGQVFSDIVTDGPGGAKVICVAVPITGEQGEFLGAMAGMFRLGATTVSAFYGDIVKLRLKESGSVYLVDGNGRVIYHSDPDHIGEDSSTQPIVQQVLNGQMGAVRTRNFEGQDIVASFAPVPGTAWGLVAEENWTALTIGYRGYQQFLLFLLALGVVVPAIVVAIGVRQITRPIVELIGATQAVAQGDLGQTITAHTGDEIEELASQFSLMSAQLQESYAHLEQRVAERTKELAALNAIAAVVSRSLDLQEILEDALDKTLEVTGLEAGGIYLLQKDDEVLTIVAHKGLSAQSVAEIDNLKMGEGFSGHVVQTGEPLVVRDVSTDPRLTRSAVKEAGFHSVAIFPLVSRGKVLGSLFVMTRGYREFSQQDTELLTSIGHQIGVAMENARMFRDTARQVQELRVLTDASRIISSVLDQDQLLQALYEQITRIAPADFYLIALYDKVTNVVSIEINVDEGVHYPKDQYVLDKGLLKLVIHNQQLLRFHSLTEEKARLDVEIVPSGSSKVNHGWLGVPMLYGDKVMGAIAVGSYQRGAFDEGHQQILASIANEAAVALENARLYAEAQQRAEEQAVLNELGQALTARLNVEQVLDEAYRGASRLLDTTNFYVALYNPDEDEITFAIDVKEGELRKPYTTRQAGRGLTEHIIRHRTPLLIEENLPKRLEEMGIELIGPVAFSWLGVPLMIGHRVIGVMAVQSYTTPRVYDKHDQNLLTAIASQAAIAIQNAHLFEETSSRAERLAVINRIASAASATLHLDDLLERVYQEIVPAFQADAFFIALYDQETNELDFRFQVDQGVREPPERLPLGVGLASLVVIEKKPLVIRDEQERNRLLSSPHTFGTMKRAASWLGAPMLVGQRVIGVISVQAYRPYAWGEEDQLLLLTIADQVAVALENARLFAEAEQRMQELEALYRADEELYRHLRLDEVLQALTDVTVDILQADKSSLMVWDAQREKLTVRAARGFHPESIAQMVFSLNEGVVGRVAASGEPIIVEDTHTDPSVATRITEPEGIRSFMNVPIKIGGQIFGVFNVDYLQPRGFGAQEQRLFLALAQRAALAIENAQLYEQAQQVAMLEERQRLARELHDAVTQTLFSASLIAEVLPRLWELDANEGKKRLDELRELTRGALAEMRTLLLELRPAALIDAEIGALLRQLGESIIGRARVPVIVEVEGECSVPLDVKVALYRIAQEALNNVAKHSGASQATVSLRCASPQLPPRVGGEKGRVVELCVSDDGQGFDTEDISPDHLGLGIMRERAEAIGATLKIESQIGHGTQVAIVWPSTSVKGS
jgi:GAF domain-containing protein/HAMP domain-containing protein